jgi:hypothetical protein
MTCQKYYFLLQWGVEGNANSRVRKYGTALVKVEPAVATSLEPSHTQRVVVAKNHSF